MSARSSVAVSQPVASLLKEPGIPAAVHLPVCHGAFHKVAHVIPAAAGGQLLPAAAIVKADY